MRFVKCLKKIWYAMIVLTTFDAAIANIRKPEMSPDDVDSIALEVFDLLVNDMGLNLDEDADFIRIHDLLMDTLDKFITRDRNYN